MRPFGTPLSAALAAALLLAAPAFAKPPPAGVWVDVHFTDARGKAHTYTEQVQIPRADYAQTECTSGVTGKKAQGYVNLEKMKHPETASMTFVGANCVGDKSGGVKTAVGAWPGARTPTSGAFPPNVYFHFTDGHGGNFRVPQAVFLSAAECASPAALAALARKVQNSDSVYASFTYVDAKCRAASPAGLPRR